MYAESHQILLCKFPPRQVFRVTAMLRLWEKIGVGATEVSSTDMGSCGDVTSRRNNWSTGPTRRENPGVDKSKICAKKVWERNLGCILAILVSADKEEFVVIVKDEISFPYHTIIIEGDRGIMG